MPQYQPSPSNTVPDRAALKALCLMAIERREGPSGVSWYLRRSWWRGIVLPMLLMLFVGGAVYRAGMPMIAVLFVGMVGGRVLRDIAWWRRLAVQWPLTSSILDWEKVEKLAADRNSDS